MKDSKLERQANESISDLIATIEKLEDENSNLERENGELNDIISSLEEEIEELKDEIKSLGDELFKYTSIKEVGREVFPIYNIN